MDGGATNACEFCGYLCRNEDFELHLGTFVQVSCSFGYSTCIVGTDRCSSFSEAECGSLMDDPDGHIMNIVLNLVFYE